MEYDAFMEKIVEGLIKIPLYGIVFLLPLFFLPFTQEIYEFNKLYLSFGLILLSLLGWFGKLIFIERAFVFRRTPLDLGVLFFFLAALVSTIFSQDIISSLLGFYGRFSGGFVEFLLWILFYFIITNNVSYPEAKRFFTVLFTSAFLLAVFLTFSWLGLLKDIPFLSLIVTSPLGISPQQLAVFEALTLVFLLLYYSLWAKKEHSLFSIILSLGFIALLVMVNFPGTWVLLLFALGPFFFWTLKEKILSPPELNRLTLVTATLLISLTLLIFRSLGGFSRTPLEILLSYEASWRIAYNTLTSIPFTFIGSGLGNFFGAYNLFRPLSFNQAIDWPLRFDIASSHFATMVATMGVTGIVGFGLFLFFTGWLLVRLFRGGIELKREVAFYAFGFLGILVSFVFYYQTVSLSLLFWMTLAPLALLSGHALSFKEYRYEFGISPEANLLLTSFFFVGVFLIALLGYFGGRFYIAEVRYREALFSPDSNEQLSQLEKAVALQPFRIEYRIALAQASLQKLNEEVAKIDPQETQDTSPLALLASQAVNQAQAIVALAPRSVIAWEGSASLYRDLKGLVPGEVSHVARQAFLKSLSLEPTNPAFPVQIALLLIDEGNLEEAQTFLSKAKDLKGDYVSISLAQALLLEKQDKLQEALDLLDQVTKMKGLPPSFLQGALFHLGRIAYNANETEKAIQALERVIELNPSHTNAHYVLALAYERAGEYTKAKDHYKKVLDVNPANQEVKTRLKEL